MIIFDCHCFLDYNLASTDSVAICVLKYMMAFCRRT
jgi:hypothetical protein